MTQPSLIGGYDSSGATFDPERIYRYTLHRVWRGGLLARTVLWIMLNPSTADESVLDPTLRRCERYARDWGFDGFTVVNLFAFRSTDPDALPRCADPVGPENDRAIREAIDRNELVICAWGSHGIVRASGRRVVVGEMLKAAGKVASCLGVNADGNPKHPLYLSKLLKPTLLDV